MSHVAHEDTPLLTTQQQQPQQQHRPTNNNDDEDPAIAALPYDPYDGDSGERLHRRHVRDNDNDGMIGRRWFISIAIYATIVTILLLLQQRHYAATSTPQSNGMFYSIVSASSPQ
jgi:hypothetical protein